MNAALQDGTYKVRAVTRNVNSEKAKALAARGVEVVTADINSEQSLVKAFEVRTNLSFPAVLWLTPMSRVLLRFTPSQTFSNRLMLEVLNMLC